MLSTRIHGVLDYLVGVLLILAPQLLGFSDAGVAAQIPVWLGVATILYSLLTRYELGLLKVLPFGVHLGLDFLSGAFLAASPWLFGFADQVWVPHVAVGCFEIVAVLLSRSRTSPTVHARRAHPAH